MALYIYKSITGVSQQIGSHSITTDPGLQSGSPISELDELVGTKLSRTVNGVLTDAFPVASGLPASHYISDSSTWEPIVTWSDLVGSKLVKPDGSFGGASFANLGELNSFVSIGVQTNGSGTSDGILRDSSGAAIPSLVANFTPRTGLQADLLALAGSAGELASPTDKPSIVKFNGVAGQGTVFNAPQAMFSVVNVTTTPTNNIIGTFTTTATYVVGTHFTTNASALAFMQQCTALPGVTITLRLANGAIGTSVLAPMPWLAISGQLTTLVSMLVPFVSVAVTGGSDGFRSLFLDVSASDGLKFTAGQPFAILLQAQITGSTTLTGTNNENLVGVYVVTSVTAGGGLAGKTRITVNYGLNALANGVSSLPGIITGQILLPPAWFTPTVDAGYFHSIFGLGFINALSANTVATGGLKAFMNPTPYVAGSVVGAGSVSVGSVSIFTIVNSGIRDLVGPAFAASRIRLMGVAIGSPSSASFSENGITPAAGSLITGDNVSLTGQYLYVDQGIQISLAQLHLIMGADADILGGFGVYTIILAGKGNRVIIGSLTAIRTSIISTMAVNSPQPDGNLLAY